MMVIPRSHTLPELTSIRDSYGQSEVWPACLPYCTVWAGVCLLGLHVRAARRPNHWSTPSTRASGEPPGGQGRHPQWLADRQWSGRGGLAERRGGHWCGLTRILAKGAPGLPSSWPLH